VPPFSVTRKFDIGGRRWTVLLAPTASFEREAHGPAIPITAATGVLLSLAFFFAARAQANARAAAERAADEIRRSLAKRERAEQALRQSSRRVQMIIDSLPALISFVDTEQRYRFVSRSYQEWFGVPSQQVVGKTLTEVLGERAMKELRPHIERVMTGEHVTFEATVPFRSGGQRIVHANYSPHFSETGSVEGFIALVTDVTKQKRAEDWQRFLANATGVLASSMDYETTLQSVAQLSVPRIADHCAVYMADAGGTLRRLAVAHVDPAKLALLNDNDARFSLDRNAPIGPVQVLRTGVSELIPHVSEAAIDSFTADPEHRAAVLALNVRSAMTVPLRFRDEIMGAITFTLSETARAYTDEDLQRAEDLARRAAAAIENARLYSAAQEAIRIRDEFLSIASHELKTPLTPLQLQLDSLAATLRNSALTSDKLNHRLETANRQTRRLTKLVENLLDVSRISAGRLSLDRERFDLSEITTEVAERFGADAAAAGCQIAVHTDHPVVGQWDRLRLEQVVSNLLSNAIKYGAGKPIEVHVRQEGGAARLVVADQGIGISPEDSARIFGRFERAVPLRHYGGMGLGLYIARQIVDAHGGSIVVSSAPGRGSTFTVVLPLTATESDHAGSAGALGSKTLQ
jgi:PAS domain S-box-containing protein